MKDTLQVGIENEMTYTVTAEMSPAHLPVKVLSTPSMIQLIEGTCLQGVQPHLDDNETTVGTHGAQIGAAFQAVRRLLEEGPSTEKRRIGVETED